MSDNTGHNEPPTDADPLRDRLTEENAGLLARRDALVAGAGRAPEVIEDEETAGKMADFTRKQIGPCLKDLEDTRIKAKEPFLSAGRSVDGYFKNAAKPLIAAKEKVDAAILAYARKKEAAERAARQEEERLAREEAERLTREAEEQAAAMESDDEMVEAVATADQAAQAAADAEKAAKAAAAKPAELSRIRGEGGGVASLKRFWDYADLDRDALDLEALRDHLPMAALEQAVGAYVKAGGRELKGARIFENTRL